MENGSIADIAAVARPNYMGGGFGGNTGEWIFGLIFLAAMFNGGFGFGGNRGAGLTQAELQQGFDTQSLLRGQEGIKNGLCDGFYAMNTTNLQAQNQTQRDMCQGFSAVNAAINETRFAQQNCCCEIQRAIDGVNYNNSQNTCNIVNAIHSEGEATRNLITQNKIEALQTRNAELVTLVQQKDLKISQMEQNEYLVNQIINQLKNQGCNGYS